MPDLQPRSFPTLVDRPRMPREEVADLLATALLRLRAKGAPDTLDGGPFVHSEPVELGFSVKQRANTRLVLHKPAR